MEITLENNKITADSRPGLRPDLLIIAGLIQPEEKVLDLGCGDGALLRYLMDTRSVTARGIELTEAGVLACVRKGVSVRQGDLHEGLGDYPDGSFDTVILSHTIPYLNDPAFILCEMLRVGRRAIVSFPNWGYWRSRLSLLLTGRMPSASLCGVALPGALTHPEDSQNGAQSKRSSQAAPPRARPLTIGDFQDFCSAEGIRIEKQIFLDGAHALRTRLAASLRSSTAIFVLGG